MGCTNAGSAGNQLDHLSVIARITSGNYFFLSLFQFRENLHNEIYITCRSSIDPHALVSDSRGVQYGAITMVHIPSPLALNQDARDTLLICTHYHSCDILQLQHMQP